MIGLKRGVVELCGHDPQWKTFAAEMIRKLGGVLGAVAVDIRHVGSTAIASIKAKPIVDIAVAVNDLNDIDPFIPALEQAGFTHRPDTGDDWQRYFVRHDLQNDLRTCHVHVVRSGSREMKDYLLFVDFLNANPGAAKEYERIKLDLMEKFKTDRAAYTEGKTAFCAKTLRSARLWDEFGRKFARIEAIEKGWSPDKKYAVETADGQKLLLRVADIAEYDRKKAEYGAVRKAAALGAHMPQPFGFGVCGGGQGVYYMVTWLEGKDAAAAMRSMTDAERYVLGRKSGELLRALHALPAPEDAEDWESRFWRKIDVRISEYRRYQIKAVNGEAAIQYLNDNAYLLKNRPQTFNHGDFNTTNIIVAPDGTLGAVDFNCFNDNRDYGDPLWELICISYMEEPDPYYYTGLWNGYCGGAPDGEFFRMTAYYFAYDLLSSLGGDENFDNGGFDKKVLAWYDNFSRTVPSWYLKDERGTTDVRAD